jgi:hypothetical protein
MGTLALTLFFLPLLVSFVGSLVWIYRDAELRGKSGGLVAFLAAVLGWPITLLVWIALRPPPSSAEGGRRPFNLQDFRQQ